MLFFPVRFTLPPCPFKHTTPQHRRAHCRQRAICGMEGGQNRYGRYQDLFSAPSGDELDATYQKIAGDSYRTMNPTLAALVRSVDSATLSADAEAAKNVCDDSITESMDLDEVRLLDLNSHAH